ncbi:ankyrin repeat-containing domain protein [Phellopilus nigrolimitatus]|nr:ankyrin repeat-containing domain protein [Phellopilus nigrolimitatus]
MVTFLLERNAEVDSKNNIGWTPLHCAVSAGREAVVRELLGAGANVNAKTSQGMTPLHYAASKQQVDIGKLLITRKADINARNGANQLPLNRWLYWIRNTPLHLAMESAHAEVAVMLIEAGADRERVSADFWKSCLVINGGKKHQTNVDGEIPEQLDGVGGQEQRRAKEYIRDRCGPAPS